jgi:hypothetical protein
MRWMLGARLRRRVAEVEGLEISRINWLKQLKYGGRKFLRGFPVVFFWRYILETYFVLREERGSEKMRWLVGAALQWSER